MKCTYCGDLNTKVLDTRLCKDDTAMRRRRECGKCGHRFTTYETAYRAPKIIIKKDGNREEYDRQKINLGILRACHKRPISADVIETIVDDIEKYIYSLPDKEISSTTIGEMVLNRLKNTDEVAYVRFASVYRHFKDVKEFEKELTQLKKVKK